MTAPLKRHSLRLTSLFVLFVTLGALLIPLAAQQPASAPVSVPPLPKAYNLRGYLRFVNATGHSGNLRVFLNGEDVNPDGYTDGFATGTVGYAPHTCLVEMRHATLGDSKISVTLKPGEVASVIALPVIKSSDKGKGNAQTSSTPEPAKIELGAQVVFSPGYVKGKELNVTVLQATVADKLDLKIGSLPLTCPKLEPTTLSLGRGLGEIVPISLGNKQLLSLNFTDPSDRVVILFTNKEGVLKNITLNNEVF